MCFYKVKHYFGHISEVVGPIDVKRKGSASVGYWVPYVWHWPLTSLMTVTVDVSMSNFETALSRKLLVWLMWNEKEHSWWYLADCMTLPFDHTHDLDLGVSRSESEIALSQGWDGQLTWNKKYVSHSFMTMILTSVTMVGWADVPDSGRVTSNVGVPSIYLVSSISKPYSHIIPFSYQPSQNDSLSEFVAFKLSSYLQKDGIELVAEIGVT